MARQETKIDLVVLIRLALDTADSLGEWGAAAHLDQALIALGEHGAPPRVVAAG